MSCGSGQSSFCRAGARAESAGCFLLPMEEGASEVFLGGVKKTPQSYSHTSWVRSQNNPRTQRVQDPQRTTYVTIACNLPPPGHNNLYISNAY